MINKKLYALEILVLLICIVGFSAFAFFVFKPEINFFSIGMWGCAVFVSTLTMFVIFMYEVHVQMSAKWIIGYVIMCNCSTIFMVLLTSAIALVKWIIQIRG